MDTFTIAERELALEQAEQRILADLEALGLSVETRTLGQRIVAVQAAVSATDPPRIARGAGKGYPQPARIGALYETLEHYLSEHFTGPGIDYLNPQYFSQKPLFADDSVLSLITAQLDAVTACRTFTDAITHASFYYPMALCIPGYSRQPLPQDTTNYRALQRYASNSGTAIGATDNEAVLHATNECIERDAVSLFLLDQFYYENHAPLRLVARPADHEALGRLWSDAEAEIGSGIVLVDISSEFLARTFLAFSTTPGPLPKVFGSGCSLNARHGAWRALTELVQLHHTALEPELNHYLSNAQRHLMNFPRLLRCLRFDPYPLLQLCEQQTVELPEAAIEQPLAEQIDLLAKDLLRHGRSLGISRVHRTALGTTLVNVVIPGLERFFVVSSGNVVVAQARGRRLENKYRGAQ
ncbi:MULTISPECIES: YcaO-like family protein [unclassified Pseudomonas]|uniref:YcaO-like family protein n=1 Tax=unclassified Pseudomonas TaxID=196821 RepID=UPI002AC9685E|nr:MULTISPECIES: YcaO-like family protein [unclassified Pseudomonas]MEB0046581.1 YcaO-like family protein [Pseudomonas sp. Dout3]MEB0095347.1 YcaO-like family protein [Pseudomonas sp. DC1.2]WPX60932.1 YcaO-like family protein [Pseudomonas sp. DC1.2]